MTKIGLAVYCKRHWDLVALCLENADSVFVLKPTCWLLLPYKACSNFPFGFFNAFGNPGRNLLFGSPLLVHWYMKRLARKDSVDYVIQWVPFSGPFFYFSITSWKSKIIPTYWDMSSDPLIILQENYWLSNHVVSVTTSTSTKTATTAVGVFGVPFFLFRVKTWVLRHVLEFSRYVIRLIIYTQTSKADSDTMIQGGRALDVFRCQIERSSHFMTTGSELLLTGPTSISFSVIKPSLGFPFGMIMRSLITLTAMAPQVRTYRVAAFSSWFGHYFKSWRYCWKRR